MRARARFVRLDGNVFRHIRRVRVNFPANRAAENRPRAGTVKAPPFPPLVQQFDGEKRRDCKGDGCGEKHIDFDWNHRGGLSVLPRGNAIFDLPKTSSKKRRGNAKFSRETLPRIFESPA